MRHDLGAVQRTRSSCTPRRPGAPNEHRYLRGLCLPNTCGACGPARTLRLYDDPHGPGIGVADQCTVRPTTKTARGLGSSYTIRAASLMRRRCACAHAGRIADLTTRTGTEHSNSPAVKHYTHHHQDACSCRCLCTRRATRALAVRRHKTRRKAARCPPQQYAPEAHPA